MSEVFPFTKKRSEETKGKILRRERNLFRGYFNYFVELTLSFGDSDVS